MKKKRIAIFASGNGSNAENIIRYFQTDDREAEVALVVCNRQDAKVLQRAESLGVPAIVVPKRDFNNETFMTGLMRDNGIDFIVLAGFLLMIPDFLISLYPEKIVNIHPSLLPKYGGKGMYGEHVHEAVVAAGEKESGITIHIVDENCDGGRIVFQAKTIVEPTDTPDDVATKVHALEYLHFPRVIDEMLSGKL
ncbi:MAG: phosphoribosylglycinamide formyltransferase [Muribaculaceae bacterium]|nr:phosphoribosylglycinamide formyltransferase [Muribaculaceae bacterium]